MLLQNIAFSLIYVFLLVCMQNGLRYFFSKTKQVDDILGEESDNESEGRGKEKPGNEDMEDEEEEQQQEHQQLGAGQALGGSLVPQALSVEERLQTKSSEASHSVPRWGTLLISVCIFVQINGSH